MIKATATWLILMKLNN